MGTELGNTIKPDGKQKLVQTYGMEYDPSVIYKFAAKLYASARWIVAVSTIVGLAVGAGIGYAAASTNYSDQQPFTLFGALICGLVGLAIGLERAFWLKLQAQVALCQVRIEENTRS